VERLFPERAFVPSTYPAIKGKAPDVLFDRFEIAVQQPIASVALEKKIDGQKDRDCYDLTPAANETNVAGNTN